MEKIQLGFLAVGLLAASCEALANTNYFTFPSKTDDIPLVHLGDTLNVTWLSDYSQAVMYFWCDSGAKKMDEIRSLGGDGLLSVVVNSSWTSPCHWQYCQQANEAIFVDSGHVRVTNERATPAVTWIPESTLGTACGIQSATVTNSVGQTITTTVAASATATTDAGLNSSLTTSTACPTPEAISQLSSGAGIGIGIAVGLVIAGVTAAVWIPLRRRFLGRTAPNYPQDSSQAALYQQSMHPKPAEVDNQARAEIDNEGRVGVWALSELPSVPHKHSP